MVSYCSRIPHTGSRADYWPHLFTPHHTPSTQKMSTNYDWMDMSC
ncbi:hypothetical protein ABFY69_33135 [Brevibacillus brevis]